MRMQTLHQAFNKQNSFYSAYCNVCVARVTQRITKQRKFSMIPASKFQCMKTSCCEHIDLLFRFGCISQAHYAAMLRSVLTQLDSVLSYFKLDLKTLHNAHLTRFTTFKQFWRKLQGIITSSIFSSLSNSQTIIEMFIVFSKKKKGRKVFTELRFIIKSIYL